MRLTFAKPKFEISISRPQEYAVRDMVTRWHGGECTVRKVMHVGCWDSSLCYARKDENRAFDMDLQTSWDVIWEMWKLGRRTLTERGFHFFMKQLNHWKFRSIHTSEFTHWHCLFEVWIRLLRHQLNQFSKGGILLRKMFGCHMINVYREQVTFRG